MIEKALDALAAKNWTAFAACFSEDGRYIDYCPSCNGGDNYFVYGSAAIEMFFRNRFTFDHLDVFDPVIEHARRGNYFAAYDGPYLHARFEIEAFADDGLIKYAVVRPA